MVLLCLVGVIGLARAEDNSFRTASTSTGQERQEARQEERQERREDRQAERRAKLGEIMERRLGNLEQMFELRVDWLDNIITRIESRMVKLSANGVDTSEANAKLATAKTALVATRAEIAGVMDQAEAALTSNTPLQSFRGIKGVIGGLSEEIKAVHRQLVEVITLLKNAVSLRENN